MTHNKNNNKIKKIKILIHQSVWGACHCRSMEVTRPTNAVIGAEELQTQRENNVHLLRRKTKVNCQCNGW